MTRLRKLMLDELEPRNAVADFARYFQRSPDQLRLHHIRDYQVYLFRTRQLTPNSVGVQVAALRFLFVSVLKRRWILCGRTLPRVRIRCSFDRLSSSKLGWPAAKHCFRTWFCSRA